MSKFWKLLTPTQVVKQISDIRPADLSARGITSIITDLDNTLVPWRRYNIAEDVIKWLADLEAAQIKICIASNTLHTSRLKKLAEEMRIPFVDRVRKPWVGGFLRAMQLMQSSREQTAVVGDQIFTDVLCGNRLQLHTILLRPPLAKEEFLSTRLLRHVENSLINFLQRKGIWPMDKGPKETGLESSSLMESRTREAEKV
jgi:HAD superfamily phosphatase (TIGR01668 family)